MNDGSCCVTVTYTGLNGLREQTTTWADPDMLDNIMERANPRRKNGRIKNVAVCVEFFYHGTCALGRTWGPALDQGYWYFWHRH